MAIPENVMVIQPEVVVPAVFLFLFLVVLPFVDLFWKLDSRDLGIQEIFTPEINQVCPKMISKTVIHGHDDPVSLLSDVAKLEGHPFVRVPAADEFRFENDILRRVKRLYGLRGTSQRKNRKECRQAPESHLHCLTPLSSKVDSLSFLNNVGISGIGGSRRCSKVRGLPPTFCQFGVSRIKRTSIARGRSSRR